MSSIARRPVRPPSPTMEATSPLSFLALFVQDNFHITPKFTLNLGLRWDIFGGRTERYDRQEYFDPNISYTVNGLSLKGGEQFVSSGHRSPFDTNYGNFGPRASFAWQNR